MHFSKTRASLLVLTATTIVLCAVEVARGQSSQTGYHYHYFKQERSLPLDVDRIAIFRSQSEERESAVDGLQRYGIESEDAERWAISGWWMVAVPQSSRNPEGIEGLLAAVKDVAGIDFVSPVFVGTDGGPLIITRDILIGFHSTVSAERAETILQTSGAGKITDRNWAGMPGAYRVSSNSRDGLAVLGAANALAAMPEVKFAEPDVIFTGRSQSIPNDPDFALSWGLHNTGQTGGTPDMDMDGPEAWDMTLGDGAIKVLIIDVGVQQDHPDINQVPGVDTTSQGPGDGGPVNANDNHGTAVAGCVSAIINNNLGTVGIAPDCNSVSARTFIGTGPISWTAQSSWTVESLDWAQSNGVRVTSNSNMYDFFSSAIVEKYEQTREAGMVHFACAGNDGSQIVAFPAYLPSVNAVTALDHNGDLADFATTGEGLAFTAPGVDIYTTDRTGPDGYIDGDYTYVSGCSFATPFTAGVAALLLSEYPAADPVVVESILRASSMDLGAPGYDLSFGWGFVNAQAALELCIPTVDCNGNGLDDSCDIMSHDCNTNGVPDDCDIADRVSQDCNTNDVPDECIDLEDDCNDNQTPDLCDIADGTSSDDLPAGGDGIPDECQFDCNGNQIPDDEDIVNDTSADCNDNSVPDECDVADGTSADCNTNNSPDECDVAPVTQWANTVIDFSSQGSDGSDWSAEQALGEPDVFGYGDWVQAWSPLPKNGTLEYLTLGYANHDFATGVVVRETWGNGFVYRVDVVDLDDTLHMVWSGVDPSQPGAPVDFLVTFPPTEFLVKGVKIYVNTSNNTSTWEEIDAVQLLAPPLSGDCNNNGVPDECDINSEISEDCTGNGVPDECEPDCNENEQADSCDLADGSSEDCNDNAVPDECDVAEGTSEDCNANTAPDECDLADGTSEDCDANSVPDECDPDCNENNQPDTCDITEGISIDCNDNAVPDECEGPLGPPITGQPLSQEVEPGSTVFFTVIAEGVLLEYQWRKDGLELIDTERIFGSQTATLLILDVEPGDAGDYDCVVTDVFSCSTVSDVAVLTVTEDCPADLNGSGEVGAADLAMLLAAWGRCADPDDCPADLNADGAVGAADLAQLLAAWGPCP